MFNSAAVFFSTEVGKQQPTLRNCTLDVVGLLYNLLQYVVGGVSRSHARGGVSRCGMVGMVPSRSPLFQNEGLTKLLCEAILVKH